jgi:hypothetical protein
MPAIQHSVRPCELPPSALLRRYVYPGAYTDCYATEIATPASHAEYTEAFYTTLVFRLERLILACLVSRPSTDADVARLAKAATDSFAAWTVEDRAPDQLLLCDYLRRTRSWLMVVPFEHGAGTRLYFGSAVIPMSTERGVSRLGTGYSTLLGFHKLYSRILLRAARSRLVRLAKRNAVRRRVAADR